jgi:hypothetical protein
MTDSKHRQDAMNKKDMENDVFDRELDLVLAQFATVEPRAGLEERVLANMRTKQDRAEERSLWRWPALAALAAILLVTISLVWRSAKSKPDITVQHAPKSTHFETQVAGNRGVGSVSPQEAGTGRQSKPHVVSHSVRVIPSAPKLDQFPSPQPLSEQEKILAGYVTKYPEHAALIAQARTEELLRDATEEMGEAARNEDSQQRNK